ncbi:MAG: hypothetical protein LBQ73_05380 [Tannerellaceae bacterium]|jgi:hypothetical protein|nr:hypothetical protein [Tannerellaceae bacterium]
MKETGSVGLFRRSRIRLRRIEYNSPIRDGFQACVLYTTLTDPKMDTTGIVLKYATRWDIEISYVFALNLTAMLQGVRG